MEELDEAPWNQAMQRVRLADIPLQPLRIPACWEVEINQFYQVRPTDSYFVEGLTNGNIWELFVPDMLFLRHTTADIGVDLGWCPEAEPEGSFLLQAIFGEDWARPAVRFETKIFDEAVGKLEFVLQMVPLGAFGEPPRRPKARRR
jgi:hypothetical protein